MKRFFLTIAGVSMGLLLMAHSGYAYCGDSILEASQGEQCDDGNFINRDGCSAYCELEDMTPAEVTSVSIQKDAINVSTILDYIVITFSEPVDPASIDGFSVRLVHGPDEIAIRRELSEDGLTLTIYLEQELFSDDAHAIRIRGVRDLPGNVMLDEYVHPFTTEVAIDRTPPNIVPVPPGGEYHFPQNLELKPYLGSYTRSDEYLDEGATIYYTINGNIPTKANAQIYEGELRLFEDSVVRYFGIDEKGNVSDVQTQEYVFNCAPSENYKEREAYPSCKIISCERGYKLLSNACIVENRDADAEVDYALDAATAPLFSSPTPLTISSKPAIRITEEHEGVIKRPVIFKDPKRGTELMFERDTGIRYLLTGEPYVGYILPPDSLYLKDFPINFGYSFKAIFEFKGANGEHLSFLPPYRIRIPFDDFFDEGEPVTIFTYEPNTETYTHYLEDLYEVKDGYVEIRADRTETFFVAQPGHNFNRLVFEDSKNHWAKNYIELLQRKGIVRGKTPTTYAPNDLLTRAEFTKIALEAIDQDPYPIDDIYDVPFKDVSLDTWYVGYVKKAKELGLINGYDDGEFKPDQPINRVEAIKILMEAFKIDTTAEVELRNLAPSTTTYNDVLTDQWYSEYVLFAIKHRLLDPVRDQVGKPLTFFGPDRFITRGEMAKLAIKTIEVNDALKAQK